MTLQRLRVPAHAPLDFELPPLAPDSAVCLGLTLDWTLERVFRPALAAHTATCEHARAARFVQGSDALRHLAGRSLLRRLASAYGGMPALAPLALNSFGRPDFAAFGLGCNLSHSGNQVWAVATRCTTAGIDVESAQAPPDFLGIAACFHPTEKRAIEALAEEAPGAAMRCWARKEAVSKAVGQGLSLPLDAYAVDCGPAASGWLCHAPAGMAPQDWTTLDLPVPAGYVGALAVGAPGVQVQVLLLEMVA